MRLSPLLLSSLAFAPSLLAQRIPEVEPNGTNATAQAIPVGAQIDCNLAAGEQDWFSFTLPAATRIRIHTTGADTRIALLDGTGTIYRAIDDDSRTSTQVYASELQLNIAAGTYMIQVVGFTATIAGLYSLEIGELTPVVYTGSEVEPNDSHLNATPTGVLGTGAKKFHGTLSPDVVIGSGTVDVPAVAPIVYTSVCVPFTNILTGAVGTLAASTTTVTQTASAVVLPAANPLPVSLTPGMNITMTSGANVGLARLISGSSATSITSAGFPVASVGGDTFTVDTANTTTVTWVASLPVSNMFTANLGYSMVMTSGPNVGQTRAISSCTGASAFGSAITVSTAWPVANTPGDTFDVTCTGSTQAIRTVGALVPNAYNPTTGGFLLGRFFIRFTSGANLGLVRQIRSNTAQSITTETTITTAPVAGDTFDILMADADTYQVVLTAPLTHVWFQINEGDDSFVFGHRYEIYDAAGNALLPASSVYAPAFGTQNANCSTLTPRTTQVRVWPAGTYYIAVRPPTTTFAASTTMPGGVVPSGNYMFELHTMPMSIGGTAAELEAVGVQTNNTQATAEPIVLGQDVTGNVSGADTSDWYGPVVIPVPSTVAFQTRRNATSTTPMRDSTVILRDATGAAALTSTSGNILDGAGFPTVSSHGRISASFYLTPGTYYFDVTSPGVGAGQTGYYVLETSVLMAAPYVAASYATFASNGSCGVAPFPTLTRQFPAEVPAIGSLFARQITNMTPLFVGLHVVGLANTAPLDLGLVFGGTPGLCFLNISPDVVNTVLTDAAGSADLQILIPPVTALRGTVLWDQCFDLDTVAPNGMSLQGSNYGRFIVGERSY